jgi:hypothetical protein
MRTYISGLILIVSATAYGQPYTLPGTVFDKMAFEVVRGRSCDTLANRQEVELNKLKAVQLADGEVIRLKKSEVNSIQKAMDALQDDYNAMQVILKDKIHSLKIRLRKLTVMLIGETGLVILLVVLLL